jgi:hypothetical protein
MVSMGIDALGSGIEIGLFRYVRSFIPIAYYNRLPISPSVVICLVLDPMLARRLGVSHGGYLEEVGRQEDQIHGAARRT